MLQLSITVGADTGLLMMSVGADVAVTASVHNGTAWQPLPQLLSPNASLLLISSAIRFRASVPDCNRALATLEYRSASPVRPSVHEIARITVIVNDMGNYGCYNDCSTTEPVPLLAVSTIVIVNYGWFSHKWLLLRPGVLLGVATGIGMLLIALASVCAWLYLVNRLLSARGKVQKVFPSFGVADGVLLEDEGQEAQNATETADDNYSQDEVQANQHLECVATIDTYGKDGVPEDGVTADLLLDYCSQGISAASSSCHSTIAVECPLEGIGFHDSNGYTLPCHLEAPDQQISPATFTNELENTCMTNQIDGMPYSLPCELDYQVDKEGMQLLGSLMVSSVPLEEESQERSRSSFANRENFMPASLSSSSLVDNRLNQQNVEDEQACNDCESHSLESYENTADDQSSAVKAADRSQNEYPNQLDNEGVVINELLSSMPFGDSSSSSPSCTSAEEGSANLERTMSIEPMIGIHGKLEEDGMCALNTNKSNPSLTSHLAELFEEEISQMPELKLVLELPETSNVDENMDPLDHVTLVFSALETDVDGSLVAVLRPSN